MSITPQRIADIQERWKWLESYPYHGLSDHEKATRDLLSYISQQQEAMKGAEKALERYLAELLDAGKRQGMESLVPHTSIYKGCVSALAALRASPGREGP